MHFFNTIRAVALYEAAKGTLVVVTGFGALSLIHRDAQQFAEQLVAHMHLNPAKHYPRIFLDAAANLTESHLLLLAAFAATYGLVRFIEAYGLWYGRRWAEWFAAVSGAIYIPFEIYELFHRVSWLSFTALVLNVLVVALMVNVLYRIQPAGSSKTD